MEKQRVMISGLPGNMSTRIAKALLKNDNYELIDLSLTGPETVGNKVLVFSGETKPHFETLEPVEVVTLVKSERNHEMFRNFLKKEYADIIAIDFCQPSAVIDNARYYVENGIPFVMGTTGGDRELLKKIVEDSGVPAVIAPNMSIPIVMFMEMVRFAAANYAGALKGFDILITESHQAKKKDKSGTAIAVGKLLAKLGVKYTGEECIAAIRDELTQKLMGVPQTALGGHGWHQYSLLSPDGDVLLQFTHNINGRDTYVDGTIKALDFLTRKVAENAPAKCFDMADVIRG